MTVLSAAQDAGFLLLGRKPNSLFGTDPFGVELGLLATRAARAIAEYYDWQKIKKLATYPGDASTIAFNLAADYGRMPKKASVHSKMWLTAKFRQAKDEDEWLLLQDTNISGTPGVWILLGGQMQIFPAMPAAETARHYYISKNIVATSSGVAGSKEMFSLDSDVFVLSEELLTLSLLWRWRSLKRMEYSEDMTNYEIALAEHVAKDRGQKILVSGTQRTNGDVSIAYPGRLGP